MSGERVTFAAGNGGMHRWTSTELGRGNEERVCLHRCVIDRRVLPRRCPLQLRCFFDALCVGSCVRSRVTAYAHACHGTPGTKEADKGGQSIQAR